MAIEVEDDAVQAGGHRGGMIVSEVAEVIESFDDLPLSESLLRGIYSYGFEKPSAIQARGIKPLLLGRDTIGQAQSGRRGSWRFAECLESAGGLLNWEGKVGKNATSWTG